MQVKNKAIPIFEKAFPGDVALFAFDNSAGHACKGDDALVANRMNLGPGGKQPCMRNTTLPGGGIQYMVFQQGDRDLNTGPGMPIPNNLIGQAKGMKRVLQERGLWRPELKKQCGAKAQCSQENNCCALRIIEQQVDFLTEESLLEKVIKDAGHEVIFYPKFHCELNFIESYWAAVKRFTRENCTYSFSDLESTVETALDSVPLITIRRFANKSMRWIISYDTGLSPEELALTQKQYTSHRRDYRKVVD